ncbi:MAG: FAD/NAD(P)-binding protein [Burkholderiales bacterium]|jgi:hypothetical protein
MARIETDYLIVGGGATGLAFADTLLAEDDRAHVTIVERRGAPGGHWVDAYPFVTLHQPSAFYGVASTALGSGRVDAAGRNAGLLELATGAELLAYYDRVVRERLLGSGRVDWRPMSSWDFDARRIVSMLTGEPTDVVVRRKVVDARYLSPSIPATHRRPFAVDEGARVVPPGALADLWRGAGDGPPARFAVLGGGKTAMDTAIWLLDRGVPADAITWVVPRDSWLLDRVQTQPGEAFFEQTIGGTAAQMAAWAAATTVEDLFDRLEACGTVLRIDPTRRPTMFHLATVSRGEVGMLATIADVVRLGHVRRVAADGLELEHGRVALPAGTLCVDCTASAVERRPMRPIFAEGLVVPQLVRLPQPTFSAALIAFVEARYGDDAERNRLCRTVPFPWTLGEYPAALLAHLSNQHAWSQDKALRAWMRDCRLDGFGRLIAGVRPDDAPKQAILGRMRENAGPAVQNLARLAAAQRAASTA